MEEVDQNLSNTYELRPVKLRARGFQLESKPNIIPSAAVTIAPRVVGTLYRTSKIEK